MEEGEIQMCVYVCVLDSMCVWEGNCLHITKAQSYFFSYKITTKANPNSYCKTAQLGLK